MKYIQYLLINKLGILFFLVFIGCTSSKKIYKIEWKTKYPFILNRYNKEDIIYKLEYPVKVTLKSNSLKTEEIMGFEYFYANGGSGYLSLNREQDGKLIKMKQVSRKLYMFQEKEFLLYISSRIDTTKIIQNNFKSYIEKMEIENKDTLHISIKKFRESHPNLLEEITKGNEISINTKKEVIFIPTDWKVK